MRFIEYIINFGSSSQNNPLHFRSPSQFFKSQIEDFLKIQHTNTASKAFHDITHHPLSFISTSKTSLMH